MSDTFYLKYRPQKISQLDLKDIREQLSKVLSSGRTPHAFLFTGPKGLGKTSAARIVAKSVNCLGKTKGSFEPCNKCENCKSITAATALDLIEIDGASNRGIDDIRSLREKIKLSPTKMRRKVYVIDEVHMFTTEAFNALLKTLEEPPKHALFVLCTTQLHKLPETIKSRCLLFVFSKADKKELARALMRVIKGEGLKVDEVVLQKIANMADGSFRDATKILEQLSFAGKIIKNKDFDGFYKETNFWGADFFKLLEKKDTKKLFLVIDRLIKSGGDLKSFIWWILSVLRAMLLLKFGVKAEIDSLKIDKKILAEFDFGIEDLKRLIAIFDRASRGFKRAVIPQLPLEIAIVEWCFIKTEDGKQKTENGKKTLKDNSLGQKKSKDRKDVSIKIEGVKEGWGGFLKKIKSKNHSIEALLKAAKPTKIEEDQLIIEVLYEFHKGRLESETSLEIVHQVIEECFGCPIGVKYILGERKHLPKKKESGKKNFDDAELIKSAEEIFGGGE